MNKTIYLGRGKIEQNTGEININSSLVQHFKVKSDFLIKIEVEFGTFLRRNEGFIILEVLDEKDKVLKRISKDVKMILNNKMTSFEINSELKPGKLYKMKLTSSSPSHLALTAKMISSIQNGYGLELNNKRLGAELKANLTFSKKSLYFKDKLYIPGLISVIIPHYNYVNTIKKTLDSIMKQSYNFFEIIVVDDHSKDIKKLEKILSKYPIKTFIKNKINLKQSKTRNIGANEAIGEFLFFLDPDTVLKKKAFEKFIQKLHEHPKAGWCYSNFKWGQNTMNFYEFNPDRLYKDNCSSAMSMIRHNIFPEFDENLIKLEDWELFIRIMENGNNGVWENTLLFVTPWLETGITNSHDEHTARKAVKILHPKVLA